MRREEEEEDEDDDDGDGDAYSVQLPGARVPPLPLGWLAAQRPRSGDFNGRAGGPVNPAAPPTVKDCLIIGVVRS